MIWSGTISVPGARSARMPPTEATETMPLTRASFSAQMLAR